jgi:hypothetical protein
MNRAGKSRGVWRGYGCEFNFGNEARLCGARYGIGTLHCRMP